MRIMALQIIKFLCNTIAYFSILCIILLMNHLPPGTTIKPSDRKPDETDNLPAKFEIPLDKVSELINLLEQTGDIEFMEFAHRLKIDSLPSNRIVITAEEIRITMRAAIESYFKEYWRILRKQYIPNPDIVLEVIGSKYVERYINSKEARTPSGGQPEEANMPSKEQLIEVQSITVHEQLKTMLATLDAPVPSNVDRLTDNESGEFLRILANHIYRINIWIDKIIGMGDSISPKPSTAPIGLTKQNATGQITPNEVAQSKEHFLWMLNNLRNLMNWWSKNLSAAQRELTPETKEAIIRQGKADFIELLTQGTEKIFDNLPHSLPKVFDECRQEQRTVTTANSIGVMATKEANKPPKRKNSPPKEKKVCEKKPQEFVDTEAKIVRGKPEIVDNPFGEWSKNLGVTAEIVLVGGQEMIICRAFNRTADEISSRVREDDKTTTKLNSHLETILRWRTADNNVRHTNI